ncbi:MAG: N-acyl homoserine lactonase family protein [Solirubrobacterales bacterium]|nr:N-acyl homoserine lactonase family protein [Solirubrobacterales bacterium]
MSNYSIYIVEYSHVLEYPIGGVLYGAHNEGHLVLPYCYGVLEGEGHLVVVDTGFDSSAYGRVLADTFGVSDWKPPAEVLGRLGFDPDGVDTAIITHNHFDHAGGVDFFPNAHVIMQAREVTHYQWVQGLADRLQWLSTACDPDLMLSLAQRGKDGKLTLVDGDAEILPGVHLTAAFETHTIGSQYVTIDNAHDGRWLMAGDNVYVYENLLGEQADGRFTPVGLAFGSMEKCMLCMDEMYRAVEEVTRIVPFHESRLWDTFPTATFDDGLHAAELSLAPGARSRLPASAKAA